MKHTFVFINSCWYLKISTLEELKEYTKTMNKHWEEALSNLLNSKEFTKYGNRHAGPVETSIGFYGSNRSLNAFEAVDSFKQQVINEQINEINKGNILLINKKGGYFMLDKDKQGVYKQWCKKDKIEFPEFTKQDIKIERFPLGNHWYAYIGDTQIRDGDKLKWNSYEEAYEYASQFVNIDTIVSNKKIEDIKEMERD